jgi:hypothetical protein
LLFSLLEEGAPSKIAFIHVITKHTLFPLLVQRPLRIVAREATGTLDGKELGIYVRNILAKIADVDDKLKFELLNFMCENQGSNVFSRNAIPVMLRDQSATSAESLRGRLEDWIHSPAAFKFCHG